MTEQTTWCPFCGKSNTIDETHEGSGTFACTNCDAWGLSPDNIEFGPDDDGPELRFEGQIDPKPHR